VEILFNQESMEMFISGLGFWGPFVFFVLQVFQVIAFPIPGNLMTVAGSILFGFWRGFLLSYGANLVGSLIGFSLVKKFGQALIKKFAKSEKVAKWVGIIGAESTTLRAKILFILVVLLPFLPSDLMCLLVGLTAIKHREFLFIIVTCRPWGQMVAALLGVSSYTMPLYLWIPLIVIVMAVCILAVYRAPQIERFTIDLSHKLTKVFANKRESNPS